MNFFVYSLLCISTFSISSFVYSEDAVIWATSPDSSFEYFVVEAEVKFWWAKVTCEDSMGVLISPARALALKDVLTEDKQYWTNAIYDDGSFFTYDDEDITASVPASVPRGVKGGRTITMNPATDSFMGKKRVESAAFICERDVAGSEFQYSRCDEIAASGATVDCDSKVIHGAVFTQNSLEHDIECCFHDSLTRNNDVDFVSAEAGSFAACPAGKFVSYLCAEPENTNGICGANPIDIGCRTGFWDNVAIQAGTDCNTITAASGNQLACLENEQVITEVCVSADGGTHCNGAYAAMKCCNVEYS